MTFSTGRGGNVLIVVIAEDARTVTADVGNASASKAAFNDYRCFDE